MIKQKGWGSENMKKKTVEYGKYGYIFIAPFFIVFLLFQLYPLIYTFYLSFVEYRVDSTYEWTEPHFYGFKNYLQVLTAKDFRNGGAIVWFDTLPMNSIKQTVIIWVINFIPQILLALLLAAWFTDTVVKLKGQGAFKVMMFLPNIITASSIAILFYNLFGNNGPITLFFKKLHVIKQDYSYLDDRFGTVALIGFMQFWMWYGNTMIVLIAGILGINPSLYEAAMVDGANGKQQFFSITLPLLKPIIQFTLVTSAIGGLQMYDIPSLFNVNNGQGLPGRASHTVTMMIREIAFQQQPDYGYAAALSVILFLFTLVISLVFFAATRDREPKQRHAVIR